MNKLILMLLSFTVISLTYITQASDFVERSCARTTHPAECIEILKDKEAVAADSPLKLAQIASALALNQSQEVLRFLKEESQKPKLGSKEQEALQVCGVKTMPQTIEVLVRATQDISYTNQKPASIKATKDKVVKSYTTVLAGFATCDDAFNFTHEAKSTKNLDVKAIKDKLAMAQRNVLVASSLISQLNVPK